MNDAASEHTPSASADERSENGPASSSFALRHGLLLAAAAVATMLFTVAFIGQWFPLGVPGEWHWGRLGPWDPPITSWIALLPAAVFAAGLVGWVLWTLGRVETASRRFFVSAVLGVTVLGGGFQLFLEVTAPTSLQKWGVLYYGARAAARYGFSDPGTLLRDHAEVISTFEPNHVSVNPVGWVLVYRSLMTFYEAHPAVAEVVWRREPHEVAWILREIGGVGQTSAADHAAITTVALASRFLGLLIPLPIAWFVVQRYGRSAAIVAAAAALLIPVASLLAPVPDTVYPTFASLIWALSYHAARNRSWWAAGAAGVLVGVGMLFSLCFVVVAALAAVMVALQAAQGSRPSWASIIAVVAGWLIPLAIMAVCGHRAWDTWQVNLAKNREFNFYSGCSYGVWVVVNLLELAVALGLPLTLLLLIRSVAEVRGLIARRGADPLLLAWLGIVALLDVSGVNRGEICRLWYFLMPVAAALAVERIAFAHRSSRWLVAGLLVLQAFQSATISRELILIWYTPPHSMGVEWREGKSRRWAAPRRLSEEEMQRQQQP